MSRARFISWQAERFVDSFPNEFAGTMSKWSAFASEALRAGLIVVVFGVVIFLYVWYAGIRPGDEWGGARDIMRGLLRRPGQLGVLLFFLFLFYRRVSFRVNDVDVERRGPR